MIFSCSRLEKSGDLLAYEKEKKLTYVVMALGFAAIAAGVAIYLTSSKMAGALLAIIGLVFVMITGRIADMFFKLKTIEEYENRKNERK
jgi:membrane protein implicated in regulation of membrane protease activity